MPKTLPRGLWATALPIMAVWRFRSWGPLFLIIPHEPIQCFRRHAAHDFFDLAIILSIIRLHPALRGASVFLHKGTNIGCPKGLLLGGIQMPADGFIFRDFSHGGRVWPDLIPGNLGKIETEPVPNARDAM